MQLSSEKRAWTEAELMSLPDIAGKSELVEGELIVTPAAILRHEAIMIRLGMPRLTLCGFPRTVRLAKCLQLHPVISPEESASAVERYSIAGQPLQE
ncbi:MAG: hypothetical protein V1792_14750 [Pseudomonadota bacterium]